MIDDGKINEAENILVDGLETGGQAYFEMALLCSMRRLSGKTEGNFLRSTTTPRKKWSTD